MFKMKLLGKFGTNFGQILKFWSKFYESLWQDLWHLRIIDEILRLCWRYKKIFPKILQELWETYNLISVKWFEAVG